jgi:hypothetical protein
MLVYVLNKKSEPLMPCGCRKARILLKTGKAVVIKRTPFTIKLKHGTSGYKQPITLGVDAGSKVIGLSATTEKQELFAGECHLRNDIVRLLSSRRELRQSRRGKKTRYRKARFLNRVSTKKTGWVAPSIQNKIQTHEKVISNLHKILPITKIVVEVTAFDIQKIKNPEISGKEYQEGEQMDFWNVREYVLFRDAHKCQSCKGKSKDKILNVHHIETRKTGGNSPNNLITLCETCHKDHHTGKLNLNIKRGQSFKDATFMGVMRQRLMDSLKIKYPNTQQTFGYITKNTRITKGITKTHINDAYCITENCSANRIDSKTIMRKVRSHDRVLHKVNFVKGAIRVKTRGNRHVHGFKNFDVVKAKNNICFITTRRESGQFVLSDILGNKIITSSYKNLKLIYSPTNILIKEFPIHDSEQSDSD